MKVLVLSDLWLPFPGGAERLIFNLARELQRAGDHVRVVTGYEYAQPFDGPAEIVHAFVPENVEGGRNLRIVIDDEQPDVILTHHYWAQTFEREIEIGAGRCGASIVQVVENGRRMTNARMAVYISEFVRRRVDAAAIMPEGESGVNDLVLYPLAFPEDVDAVTHDHAIGFVKPIEHKGVELVYEIARRMPDERFVVLRGEWQHIEILSDLPNVEYVEPLADIREFYAMVDRVIMPSLSEDAGTIAQECTLNGIPCVSSNVGGLVETNAGGVLMKGDVDEWVTVLRSLDDRGVTNAVVTSMRRWNPTTQPQTRAEFVRRVHALSR